MKNLRLLSLAATTAIAALAPRSQAQISGKWWTGDNSQNADNIPSGAPTATFSATSINFAVGDSDSQSLNDWLGANGTVLTGDGTQLMDNTHVELTGVLHLDA